MRSLSELVSYFMADGRPTTEALKWFRDLVDAVNNLGGGMGLSIARGLQPGLSLVHKFGHNPAVGTTYVPISVGGVYQTPTTATTLRIKAGGNANDTAAGTGAREITLQGLDENGNEVTETLATAGASASSYTTTTFLRLYRAYVSESGTYADASTASHAGDIVVEDGTNDWMTISSTGFPAAQTEIAAYTVPKGKKAYVSKILIQVESNKPVDIIFFQRQDILDATAPVSAMRAVRKYIGVEGNMSIEAFDYPMRFDALTDIGAMAKTSTGTAAVSVDFDMVIEG